MYKTGEGGQPSLTWKLLPDLTHIATLTKYSEAYSIPAKLVAKARKRVRDYREREARKVRMSSGKYRRPWD
jgi:hypothetical protein